MTGDQWQVWQARYEEREKALQSRIAFIERLLYGAGALIFGAVGAMVLRAAGLEW